MTSRSKPPIDVMLRGNRHNGPQPDIANFIGWTVEAAVKFQRDSDRLYARKVAFANIRDAAKRWHEARREGDERSALFHLGYMHGVIEFWRRYKEGRLV